MSLASELRYRLRALIRRREMDAELAAELEHHAALQAARHEGRGLAPADARRRALLDTGGVELLKENIRDARGTSTVDAMMRDLRYAVRSLRRAPAFTIAAVVALGLGIGSATAVFSMLEGVVLRPLPYRDPARLVSLWETNDAKGLQHELMSPVNYLDYRASPAFSDVAGWWRTPLVFDDKSAADPARVRAVEVTANFFTLLGVAPAVGHGFDADFLQRAAGPQVVISHRLWQTRFGASPDAVGKSAELSGTPYTIVGVMPATFDFPAGVDLWEGLTWTLSQHSRGAHFWEGIARLAPGATVDRANHDLASIAARLAADFPATNKDVGARAGRLDREITGAFRPALFALLGASGLLLLIACINVANLLLARGATRRREIALRSAIGAGRAPIVRLLLAESLLIAAVGTLLGFGVAVLGVRGLLAWSPIAIPRAADVGVNGWVLVFCAVATVVTAAAFGLVPALALARVDPMDALREGARAGGARSRRTRAVLVVAEVALAVMLLAGASLVMRSVSGLLHEDIGVEPAGVVSAELQLSGGEYADWTRVNLFYDRLLAALRARPDIAAAGIGYYLPLGVAYRMEFSVFGAPSPGPDPETAQYHSIDEGFFAALGARMVRGRAFSAQDQATTVPVAIVNETFAKQQFPGGDAIGRRIVTHITNVGPLGARIAQGSEHEIVGVVADVRNTSLRGSTEPAIYFVSRQFPYRTMNIVLRGRRDQAALGNALREEVRRLDRRLALGDVQPLDAVLASSIDTPRLLRMLLGIFALLALTLAAVGMYGVLTFTVANRRREMSLRIALGARPGSVLAMVVREGVLLAGAGFGIGVVATVLAGRSVSAFLYGVTVFDAPTMGAVLVVVLTVSACACLLPAWRASRENPSDALRVE